MTFDQWFQLFLEANVSKHVCHPHFCQFGCEEPARTLGRKSVLKEAFEAGLRGRKNES